jgi:hypothetical protein
MSILKLAVNKPEGFQSSPLQALGHREGTVVMCFQPVSSFQFSSAIAATDRASERERARSVISQRTWKVTGSQSGSIGIGSHLAVPLKAMQNHC